MGARRCACRWLTRSAPSKSRALRKLPDGNFRRPLVGSLRALTSAEMAALRCIAAARTGFLLAALHSVAERVSPRQARPHRHRTGPRVRASAACPHLRCWRGEESRDSMGVGQNQNARVLRSFPPLGAHAAMAIERERSCGSWRRRRACGLRAAHGDARREWYACPRLLFGRFLRGDEAALARRRDAFHAASSQTTARRLPTSDRQKFPSGNFRSARALSAPEDRPARLRHRYPGGLSPFARNRGMSPFRRLPAPL